MHADRRGRCPTSSDVGLHSSIRYGGACPWRHLKTMTAVLKVIRCRIGSQCKLCRTGVMCSRELYAAVVDFLRSPICLCLATSHPSVDMIRAALRLRPQLIYIYTRLEFTMRVTRLSQRHDAPTARHGTAQHYVSGLTTDSSVSRTQ